MATATRTRGLMTQRFAGRMRGGAPLVLIGHVSGRSGVSCYRRFVCITLHLPAGRVRLEHFVYITVDLAARLLTRCGLSLLRRCREGNRASSNDNYREN